MIIYLLPYPFISLFFLFNCCLIDIFVAPSTCSTLPYSTVLYISLVGRLLLGNRLPSVDFWSVGQTYILKFLLLSGFVTFTLSVSSGCLQPNLKISHWLVSAPQHPGIDMNCQNTWGVLWNLSRLSF